MLVESYEELPLEISVVHAEAVPCESVQEYSKYFFLSNENQQIFSRLFEKGHKGYIEESK